MAISAGKVAPSLVVLAFAGYCAWPSLSEMTAEAPPPAAVKVPELSPALFAPSLPARPAKNPWGGLDEAALAATKASRKAAKPSTPGTAKQGADSLNGLRLEATCILGNQRMALINGQLYAPQKTASAGNSSTPFRVISVSANKVLLECKGKTVELTYEGIVARPAAAAKAKPAGTAPSKTDRRGSTAVTSPPMSSVKKPSAATASPSAGKATSGKSGD
jgi:hypothetical protein